MPIFVAKGLRTQLQRTGAAQALLIRTVYWEYPVKR